MGMADAIIKPLFTWRSAVASKHGPPSPVTRHVLLTLALHMSEKGESCFPSIRLLCEETGLSNRAVIDHLHIAETAGWLTHRERRGEGQSWKRFEYQPTVPLAIRAAIRAELAEAAATDPTEEPEKGGERGSPPSKKVVNVAPKVVNVTTEGGERGSPEYFKSTSKSTSSLAPSDKPLEAAAPVNGNAVAYIPTVGGTEFGVSKALLAELETAYPAVDGPETLREIRAWCVTNPTKRKTARGVPRFINRWFERVQNGG